MKFKYFSMLIKILPDFVINRLFAKGSYELYLRRRVSVNWKTC
jgi:hypothetical protein